MMWTWLIFSTLAGGVHFVVDDFATKVLREKARTSIEAAGFEEGRRPPAVATLCVQTRTPR